MASCHSTSVSDRSGVGSAAHYGSSDVTCHALCFPLLESGLHGLVSTVIALMPSAGGDREKISSVLGSAKRENVRSSQMCSDFGAGYLSSVSAKSPRNGQHPPIPEMSTEGFASWIWQECLSRTEYPLLHAASLESLHSSLCPGDEHQSWGSRSSSLWQ